MKTAWILGIMGAAGVAIFLSEKASAKTLTAPGASPVAPPNNGLQQQAANYGQQALHSVVSAVSNDALKYKEDALNAAAAVAACYVPVGSVAAGVYEVLPSGLKAQIANTNFSGVSMQHPLGGPHTLGSEVASALHVNLDVTQNPVVKKVENIFHGWHW